MAPASLRYLYSFLYQERINHHLFFSPESAFGLWRTGNIGTGIWTLGLGLALLLEPHLYILHLYVGFFSVIEADVGFSLNPSQVCHCYLLTSSMVGCFGFINILFPWFFVCFCFIY
jgi:hypothetical protein